MRILAIGVVMSAVGLAASHAQDAVKVGSYDADTGRDVSNFPPHVMVDFQHMLLEVDIPDMNVPRMNIVQRLSFAPIGRPLSELQLDAKLLEITGVQLADAGRMAGQGVRFTHDTSVLTVTFNPPLAVGRMVELVTTYIVKDPPRGITWTPESPAWPGRPAQLHSQGESDQNRYWFPCHDFPNARLKTEMKVTVPDGFTVSSNGRLVETVRPGGGKPVTFHWLQDKPHVSYLVSLVVGKFDMDVAGGSSKVPLPVYAPLGRGGDIKRTFGNTAKMIQLFSKLTGRDYPWDRYAQLIVWNFGAGGMENTSATTLFDTAILSPQGLEDGDLDGLISHELAHQWFGDYITCKSWEHIWLNEGFATYFTHLWFEERDGKDAYLAGIQGSFDAVCGADRGTSPGTPGMVSKEYKRPDEVFGRAANPYPKGASILHMLRMRLGDESFFRGIAAYVAKHGLGLVETADFRRAMEDSSGESLEQFFSQWCVRAGVPELAINSSWDGAKKELVVSVEQKQKIDGYNPAFAFSLPVWVSGKKSPGFIDVSERTATARFPMAAEPDMVVIDPNLSVLARMTIEQPLAKWIAQLERGPTVASRVQAARQLARDNSNIAARSLAAVVRDNRAHELVRAECVRSLVERKDASTIADLARTPSKNRTVREVMMEAAGKLPADGAEKIALIDMLVKAAAKDESFRVKAAACRSIGKLKLVDRAGIVIGAADVESQSDRVRQGAIEGLADMDLKAGLAVAIRYAQPGTLNRTRPVAIDAVARLARHDVGAAVAALEPILSDRESRARNAAWGALVRIGDKRVIPKMEALAKAAAGEEDRQRMAAWISELKGKK